LKKFDKVALSKVATIDFGRGIRIAVWTIVVVTGSLYMDGLGSASNKKGPIRKTKPTTIRFMTKADFYSYKDTKKPRNCSFQRV
jgi:hypothetical protein